MLQWPFGYGIGMGGDALGFGLNTHGMMTIDTYYLSIALEYVASWASSFSMEYSQSRSLKVDGVAYLLHPQNEDRSFILPITVSLMVFVIIKSVFSQQENHPVVFMMLGALVALVATHRRARLSRSGDRQG